MQSHLTRRVFHAILNNEPIRSPRCRSRLLHTVPAHRTRRVGLRSPRHLQQRNLFAFSTPSTVSDQPSTLPLETGLKAMSDLMRSLADRSRSPPNVILAKAFRDFFSARLDVSGVITTTHARLLIATWGHLKSQQNRLEEDEWEAVFSRESLERTLFVLSNAQCSQESRHSVERIARSCFRELRAGNALGNCEISNPALVAYVNILALNGNPAEARIVVQKNWAKLRDFTPSPWLTVLKGWALKNNRRQLRKVTRKLEKRQGKFDAISHETLTRSLIEDDCLSAVKAMYECPISDSSEPLLSTKKAVIRYAIQKSEIAWALPIIETLPSGHSPETIDIILLWEAARGKRAAELTEKYAALVAENPELKNALTISSVNSLIDFANSLGDPQLAAEYSALASQWNLTPDMQTQLLQLDSRIQAGDASGALKQVQGIPDFDKVALANIPLMNRLITMLCLSEQRDIYFEQVSSFLDLLFENEMRLEPDTVAALTHMLLYRHDLEAVSELLRPLLGSYESDGRAKIRNSVSTFIMDSQQNSDDAWEAYELFRLAFPETGVSLRTDIMTSFFERGRTHQACLVFGHMRQSEKLAQRPKPDTYVRCFHGISQKGDRKNLELVHNMLKLDLEVDLNTRVLNGLMLAYAACDMPQKSMEIFREILNSEEGPSRKTIVVFFRVCERHHDGTREALKMMQKVKDLEIGVGRRMYTAFIGALAAQSDFELATEAIDKMEAETGYAPNRNTIGIFYNLTPYQYWRDRVQEWARVKYPEQWKQLDELKRVETEDGYVYDGVVHETPV